MDGTTQAATGGTWCAGVWCVTRRIDNCLAE
jgi:hypothetical protein